MCDISDLKTLLQGIKTKLVEKSIRWLKNWRKNGTKPKLLCWRRSFPILRQYTISMTSHTLNSTLGIPAGEWYAL